MSGEGEAGAGHRHRQAAAAPASIHPLPPLSSWLHRYHSSVLRTVENRWVVVTFWMLCSCIRDLGCFRKRRQSVYVCGGACVRVFSRAIRKLSVSLSTIIVLPTVCREFHGRMDGMSASLLVQHEEPNERQKCSLSSSKSGIIPQLLEQLPGAILLNTVSSLQGLLTKTIIKRCLILYIHSTTVEI